MMPCLKETRVESRPIVSSHGLRPSCHWPRYVKTFSPLSCHTSVSLDLVIVKVPMAPHGPWSSRRFLGKVRLNATVSFLFGSSCSCFLLLCLPANEAPDGRICCSVVLAAWCWQHGVGSLNKELAKGKEARCMQDTEVNESGFECKGEGFEKWRGA